jgi:hypothetical protein
MAHYLLALSVLSFNLENRCYHLFVYFCGNLKFQFAEKPQTVSINCQEMKGEFISLTLRGTEDVRRYRIQVA